MLTKRIVPCLDVDHGRVVKGVKFQGLQDVDDPVELAKHYSDIGADELVFYDITASNEEREIFLDVVEKTAYNVYIPFTVGGGIRTIDDFNKVLRAGADKVSVNSAAVKNPQLITEAALKFGSAAGIPGRSMSTAEELLPASTQWSGLSAEKRREPASWFSILSTPTE